MKVGRIRLGIEWLFAVAILVSIGWTIVYLFRNNHLPFTFFYEPDDTFADWFNTAYWAHDLGTYDTWETLYPPLSFVFLRLFTIGTCYPARGVVTDGGFGLAARDCDWISFFVIGAFFITNVVLTYLTLKKWDRTTAVPRTVCVALGWPMLYGLERGNLFLVAFTVFLLGFGPLLRSSWLKWICVGLAVNFKVYLVGAVLAPLLRRRWQWAEGAILATILVYLISYALLGRGSLAEITKNLQNWAAIQSTTPLDMWSATTYEALFKLLSSETYPVSAIVGSNAIEFLSVAIPTTMYATQLVLIIGAVAIWFRPEVVPSHRVVNIAVMIALISSEAGGYTSAMFMLLIMMESWRGRGRPIAIIICYIIALPIDIALDQLAPIVRDTYFAHTTTIIMTPYVKLGPFIRPLLIQIAAVSLACVTIRDVWADIRQQGWSGRWRFRRDAPLLPWIERPRPPAAP